MRTNSSALFRTIAGRAGCGMTNRKEPVNQPALTRRPNANTMPPAIRRGWIAS
jgi:hypothetical protein